MKKVIPIIIVVFALSWMAGCFSRGDKKQTGTKKDTAVVSEKETTIRSDSFAIVYRQPMNGYKVKAVVKFKDGFLPAEISFEKNGRTFTLHTESYGDTCYSKGFWGYVDRNENIVKQNRGKTLMADYHVYKEEGYNMPIYTPFFFKDLDFDGQDELVIVHYTMAVRYHDEYDVYRIVDGQPILLDYPPFRGQEGKIHNIRMTDYTEFDYNTKTATSVYPEGELKYDGRIVYGVAKNKEHKVVNGKKYAFNHLVPIREHWYVWTKEYQDFGEIVYKYVNGRKVMVSHDFKLDSIFIKSKCCTYNNDRFGFKVEYPSFMDMFEAGNNDGATFSFQNIVFKASGSWNAMEWDTKSYVVECYPKAAHKEISRNYFIISEKGKKYCSYVKGLLYGDDEEWLILSLDYPMDKKKMVQPLIDYITAYTPDYVTPIVKGKKQIIRIKK